MIDNIFLKDNNYEIINYKETNKIDIYIKSKATSCKCPKVTTDNFDISEIVEGVLQNDKK